MCWSDDVKGLILVAIAKSAFLRLFLGVILGFSSAVHECSPTAVGGSRYFDSVNLVNRSYGQGRDSITASLDTRCS